MHGSFTKNRTWSEAKFSLSIAMVPLKLFFVGYPGSAFPPEVGCRRLDLNPHGFPLLSDSNDTSSASSHPTPEYGTMRIQCDFDCQPRIRRCIIPQMFARTFFRGVLLGVLILQTLASAAEATVCKPCPDKSAALCPSFSETATMSGTSSECQDGSSLPASHQGADDHCSLCPLCLPLFIKSAPMSVSPDDQGRRFAASEHLAPNEAPTFSLLRPPIA